MSYIKNKSTGEIYKVYGTWMERQSLPAVGWSEVVTYFLIWMGDWAWVSGKDFVPDTTYSEPSSYKM